MTIQAYDAAGFETLRSIWNKLLKTSDFSNFFLTPEFFQSFAEAYEIQNIQLLTFEKNAEVVGILPCYEHDGGINQIAHLDVSDYSGLIAEAQHVTEILDSFLEYCQEKQYKHIQWLSIPAGTASCKFFREQNNPNWSSKATQQEVCPIITLPESYEAYLLSLKRKQRHEARRKMKKLKEDLDYSVRVVSDNVTDQDTTTFQKLHAASSEEKATFWTKKNEALFTKLINSAAAAGYLKLFFLEIDGEPVASMLIFDFMNRYHLYNAGFLANQFPGYSTGQVLLLETIKNAIEQGREVFDFLRGDEEYKFRLGGVAKPIFDILLLLKP